MEYELTPAEIWPSSRTSAMCLMYKVLLHLVLGCFLWFGPFVPATGNTNFTTCSDILDNRLLPTLWQKFGKGHFLFQHRSAPVHKQGPWRNCFRGFPPQSPDLNPVTLFGWIWMRAYLPTQCPTSLILLWLNGRQSQSSGSKILRKAFPEERWPI